jgi:signal transduction histidine kinase
MKRVLKIVSHKQGEPKVKSWKLGEGPPQATGFASRSILQEEKNELILNTINELVLTISHYLNTPLTVLLGKVELLSEATENGGMSKEDMKKSLHTCKREIFKIDAIVKSFQNLCRVQHKSFPPGVKMLDVEQEIKNKVKEINFLR